MARSYAKVYVSIWAGDFRDLSIAAQGLYFRLITDAKLSMCGVVDWRPRRLIQSFAGLTVPQLRALADELEAARYIVTDEDTEEVLVRTFVRHDGVLKSPNLTKAMASDWLAVSSRKIKDAVVSEVWRALAEEPTLKGSDSVPDWFPKGSDSVPKHQTQEPFPIGSDSVLVEFPYPTTSNQQPATSIGAKAPKKAATKKPSTPMPEDWYPSAANVAFAAAEGIDLDWQLGQFRAHHLARDSRFVNWDQAFRTWLGNVDKFGGSPRKAATSGGGWMNR